MPITGITCSPSISVASKMPRRNTINTTAIVACVVIATSSAFAPPALFPAQYVPQTSSSATILGASSSSAVAESAETQTSNTCSNSDASLLLLEDALRPNNNDASQKILNNLAKMRQSNQQLEAEQYLDDLLQAIDSNTQAIWTRLPTMTRFSRRARLASLARALDLSTPPADDEEEGAASDAESEGRRRRRALAVLIRTLSRENEEQQSATAGAGTSASARGKLFARPAIRSIERAALRGAKESATLADMENRIPQGLETPKYDVIVRNQKAGYEIRQYQPYSLATVGMSSEIKANDESRSKTDRKVSQPTLSGASSFGALAGYLFGKNSEQSSMAMTSPVFTSNAGDKEGREMSFVMPSDYWAEDGVTTAPQPLDGSGVKLQRNEGGTRAVVMFGGFASKSDIAKRKEQLLKSVEADKDYAVKQGSAVTLAQYNDPFTPGWKRRNEVSIDVVSMAP